MTEWYDKNYSYPYPTYRDCEHLANTGQITISQVKQWFVNVRRRTQNQFRRTHDSTVSIDYLDQFRQVKPELLLLCKAKNRII